MPLIHNVTFAVCICIQSANTCNGISVLCIFILISLTNLLDYKINLEFESDQVCKAKYFHTEEF